MQITLEQYNNIQKYLDGKMTPEAEEEFLLELNKNASLKESLEFETDLRQHLTSLGEKKNLFEKGRDYFETGKSAEVDSIRRMIEKAGNEWKEQNSTVPIQEPRAKKIKNISIKLWLAIGAAACVIAGLFMLPWLFQTSSTRPSSARNTEKPFKREDTLTTVTKIISKDSIGTGNHGEHKINYSALARRYYAKDISYSSMPDLLAMVPDKYKKGDYSFQDINLDKQPVTRGSSNDINSKENILQSGHYYKGLSYIETNNDKEAIQNLKWVIDSAISRRLKIKAQWYLALIYLKNGNTKNTIPLLTALSTNAEAIPYNKKAHNILNVLDAQEDNRKP
jgi:hypothetical protein